MFDQQFLDKIYFPNFTLTIFIFSDCQCRFGLADAHTMRSGDIVKLTHAEMSQMFVMEDRSGRACNDLRRTSQAYPGAIYRGLWTVMQSKTSMDRKSLF